MSKNTDLNWWFATKKTSRKEFEEMYPMRNQDLKKTYDQMHTEGKQAWFDDGQAEREAILEMGEPWEGKTVLEIGCGEGDLLNMIDEVGGMTLGIDYSRQAIKTCRTKYPHLGVWQLKPTDFVAGIDILVMQGVMEHLNNPFKELADMIERFKPKTVITSMPSFLNIRGIIWHTLDMLGAVMSKTDLHFIDRWEVEGFCDIHGYKLRFANAIEMDWGNGLKMIEDLRQRIPLALKDGGIPVDKEAISRFLRWLQHAFKYMPGSGAVNIYRIDI